MKIKTLILCFTLLFATNVAYGQTPYGKAHSVYASISDNVNATVGYRFSDHFSANLASGRIFFDDREVRPGIGANYEQALFGSRWGLEMSAYMHTDFGFSLIPAVQAGAFRKVTVAEIVNLYPGLSVFSYRTGFQDMGETGLLLGVPASFEFLDSKRMIVTPMLRFNNANFLGGERRWGLRIGVGW